MCNVLVVLYSLGNRAGNPEIPIGLEEARVESAESVYQTHHQGLTDHVAFERRWADALVTAGLEQLANAYRNEGRERIFETLKILSHPHRRAVAILREFGEEARDGRVDFAWGCDADARAVSRVFRQQVRRTEATDAKVDGELQELLRVPTNR